MPVWNKSESADGTFAHRDVEWDSQPNAYRCPDGHTLRAHRRRLSRPSSPVTEANTVIYRALQRDYDGCPIKASCCPNVSHRKIARNAHEGARDVAHHLAATRAFAQSARTAKRVEMPSAHLKRIFNLERLRLRLPPLAGQVASAYCLNVPQAPILTFS